ncbi:MAG: MFS transporter [Planctomycetes bacterium]|nr:MFS transporter [Planctomycetota bacterium]
MPANPPAESISTRAIVSLTWPALLATFLVSMGFAGLKFCLIGELAVGFNPAEHDPLPLAWMERIVQHCIARGNITEAITQGLAAVITLGVILGYLVNAPLSGAWRTGRLFLVAGLGCGLGSLVVAYFNPWLVMLLVGVAYGTACAARGKSIPLLSRAGNLSNTFVSGLVGAAMVLGLMIGTVLGTMLMKATDSSLVRHLVIAASFLVSALLGWRVRPQEPAPVPFLAGVRDLVTGSWQLMYENWPLVVAGGMAWGVASAASLAVFIDVQERLRISYEAAGVLAVVSVVGAVAGNVLSHVAARRRYVIGELVLMGAVLIAYPYLVDAYWQALIVSVIVGTTFASSSNVLDARFLKNAADLGQSGRGATMMSLTHSICIFVVGSGVAVALLLGWVDADEQYWFYGVASILTAGIAAIAHLGDGNPGRSGRLPRLPHR